MDGRGRLAQPLNRQSPGRRCGRDRAPRAHRAAAGSRARAPCAAAGSSACRALSARSSPCSRLDRGGGVAASAFIVLAAASATASSRADHIDPVTSCVKDVRDGAGQRRRLPHRHGIALPATSISTARKSSRAPASPAQSSLLFFDVTDARAQLDGDPVDRRRDACASSIPTACRSRIDEREAVRAVADRPAGQRHRRRRHGARAVRVAANYLGAAVRWSAAAPKSAARNCSRCSTAIPRSATNVRASILVAERRWNLRLRTASTSSCRKPTSSARLAQLVALDREKKISVARHRRRSICGMPTGHRAAFRRRRAGARRSAQGKGQAEKGGERMSSLHYGLTPKMKPLSPRRSALVVRARYRHQQDRLPDRAADAQSRRATLLRRRSHAIEVIGFGHTGARGMKAGAVVDLVDAEEAIRHAVDLRRARGQGAGRRRRGVDRRPAASPANCSPRPSHMQGSDGDRARHRARARRRQPPVRSSRAACCCTRVPIGFSHRRRHAASAIRAACSAQRLRRRHASCDRRSRGLPQSHAD